MWPVWKLPGRTLQKTFFTHFHMSEDGRSEATKRTYQQFLGKDTDEIELQLHKKKARREGFEMEIKILQRKMLKTKNEEEGLRRALEDPTCS